MDIEQLEDRVLLKYEKDDVRRTVWLDDRRPTVDDFSVQGFSVGRYEGDVLVIETSHFVFDVTGFDDLAVYRLLRGRPSRSVIGSRMES